MKKCPTPGVDGNPGPEDFQAFMTAENLFSTEAETTVRYLLSGRRYVRTINYVIAHALKYHEGEGPEKCAEE